MGWVKPLRLYTEEDEPLKTMEGVRFYLTYHNAGSSDIDAVHADITMGETVRRVKLPGVEAHSDKTVEMVLTNNIGEDVPYVEISFGEAPEDQIRKKFKWLGKPELSIGEIVRVEAKDTPKKRIYRIMIHNRGTRSAGEVLVTIDKDNERYGTLKIPQLDAKTSAPVNLALQSNRKGLFKITVEAQSTRNRRIRASRSFHIQL